VSDRRRAALAGSRPREKTFVAGENRLLSACPGLETMAIGTAAIMVRQFRQVWNAARLSAPMIQTKWTLGNRALNRSTVSTVKREPRRLSAAEAIIEGPIANSCDMAKRECKGAEARCDLSGF